MLKNIIMRLRMWHITKLLLLLTITNSIFAQDYARKFYASVHYYAEEMLDSKIVEHQEDIDLRKGKMYYYAEKDIEGQYVHISGGYSGDYYMALWKMESGNDLLGVTHFNCQATCQYECSFFECDQDTIIDITPKIFPVKKMEKQLAKMKKKVLAKKDLTDKSSQYKFILPHGQGPLQVQLSMDSGQIEFPIMELEWNGEKFVLKTKFREIPDL